MRFNEHSSLVGQHAFLSPSSYHWINYDLHRLVERWYTSKAYLLGIEQHEYAREAIETRTIQTQEDTVGRYINDAISYRMVPEQILYYSENCFGTADAVSFRYRCLRVFDLKTGVIKGSIHQLEVYAAIFCLEYGMSPHDIKIDLRIYQDHGIQNCFPDPEVIEYIMDKIVAFDEQLSRLREEESC